MKIRNFFFLLAALLCCASASAEDSVPTVRIADVADKVASSGKYIYVPDSLQGEVLRILEGHSRVVDDHNRLDPDELTIFRGDTVPMVLKSVNLGRYDRGLFNFLYIPKGVWAIGMTASYGEIGTEDLGLFGLVSDVNIGAHAFSIKPYIQYFVRNNLAVGLKFGYYNARGNVDSFNLDIMDDMSFSLNDIMYKSESYSAALTATQYLGLARRGRFGVFNEIELAFKTGNSEFTRPVDGELSTTLTNTTECQINFSPGVQIFMMKNVEFHVSFGVFGFNFVKEKQQENGQPAGNRFSSGANFRFNIFNINFGIGVNL